MKSLRKITILLLCVLTMGEPARAEGFWTERRQDIVTDLGRLGSMLVAGLGLSKVMSYADDNAIRPNNGPILGGLMMLGSNAIQNILPRLGNNIALETMPWLATVEAKKLAELKNAYLAKKSTWTVSTQNAFETLLRKHEIHVSRGASWRELEMVLEEMLELPTRVIPIEKKQPQLKDLISKYPEALRVPAAKLVADIIELSHDKNPTSRVQVRFLVGPPGTGKTHLIKQIANQLGIPLHTVSLASYKKPEGDGWWSSGGGEKGIWVDALLANPGYPGKTRILFVDEIDKAFETNEVGGFVNPGAASALNMLYSLADSAHTMQPILRYDGAELSVEHVVVILAGNRDFSEFLKPYAAKPLSSRVKMVRFEGGFNPKQKLEIVTATLKRLLGSDESNTYAQELTAIVDHSMALGHQGVREAELAVREFVKDIKQKDSYEYYSGVPTSQFDVTKYFNDQLKPPKKEHNWWN